MDNQGGRLLTDIPRLDYQPELCFYLYLLNYILKYYIC